MPAIKVLQHIFSSVERGLFADQGRGFQTVAASNELTREELRMLEENSYYTLNTEKIDTGNFPVKETFFALPNDRLAVGRTIYLGVDALGRDGNYLTHNLIFDRNEFLASGANTFAILNAAPFAGEQTDLTPREISAIQLQLASDGLSAFDNIDTDLLALLTASAIDRGTKSLLLIGESAKTRVMLEALHTAVATTERLEMTFSTRYDESVSNKLFAIAAAESFSAASNARNDFVTIDLVNPSSKALTVTSAYALCLAETIKSRNWDLLNEINRTIDALRAGQSVSLTDTLRQSPQAMLVLWERTKDAVWPELYGQPELIAAMLRNLTAAQSFADDVLKAASPSKLCGEIKADKAQEFLALLKSKASGKSYAEWAKRWANDPLFSNNQKSQGWFKRLLGGN